MTASSSDFDAVYRAHAPSVYRRARQLLGDDAEAEQVVHDVFGLLYEEPGRYADRPVLCAMLYGLTTRACFNRIRSRKLQRSSEPLVHDIEEEIAAELRDLVDRLPEPLDQVAVYYYLDELTQEEVGAILGCPKRRVISLLSQLAAALDTRERAS